MKRKPVRVPCDDIPDGVLPDPAHQTWNVVRWSSGKVLLGPGTAVVARHLYFANTWCGVMSGMTDDMESRIVDALNAADRAANGPVFPAQPCNRPCPKCGSQDIHRRYRPKGRQFDYDSAYHEQGEDGDIAYGNYRTAMATRDCIEHHCRTCCHEWNTPALSTKEST